MLSMLLKISVGEEKAKLEVAHVSLLGGKSPHFDLVGP